jgi:hypothetical protein
MAKGAKFYVWLDENDKVAQLFKLEAGEAGVGEYRYENGDWVDVAPALVGWLVEGNANLAEVSSARATELMGQLD